MKKIIIRHNSKGFILIHLMIAVFIVSSLLLLFSHRVDQYKKRVESEKAYFEKLTLCRSKTSEAIALLMDDNPQEDNFGEPWYQISKQEKFSGEKIFFQIEDECGKLNLNLLADPDSKVRTAMQKFFRTLLHELKIPSFETEEMIREIQSKAPLHSLQQIQFLRDIGQERGIDLSPFLTVYSQGRININTAPKELLEVLLAEAGPFLIKEILQKREKEAFTEKEALQGISSDITQWLTTQSFFFQIKGEEPGHVRIHVILQRELGEIKIRQWQEE